MWQRLRRNIGWSLGSLGFVAAAGFVTMFVNARALGVEGLGSYATVLALSLMLEALAGLQCWQAVVVLSQRNKEDEASIFGAALALNLASATVAVVIGCGIAVALGLSGGWAVYVHLATLIMRIPDPATGILRLRNAFAFIALVRSLVATASLIAALALWHYSAPLEAYIVVAGLIQAVSAGILLARGIQQCKPSWPTRPELREVLFYSLSTGGSGAIGAIRARGVVLLLNLLADPAAVGLYSLADRITSVMQMVYRAGFEAIFGEMANAARPLDLIVRFGLASLVVACLAYGFAVLFGERLIILAAGERFAPASAIFNLLVLAASASLVTLGLRAWIIVEIGPRAMLFCNSIALLSFLAAPWLISSQAETGAGLFQIAFELVWVAAALSILVRYRSRLSRPPME
ncbi:MAG: oligosaccharide flippase family protein [Erythrobacter sp.]|jgi:O-antigen/teichoic acid export membrane protein|nr:oligosaccharide flippase family protein [Erythrobacter sp.]